MKIPLLLTAIFLAGCASFSRSPMVEIRGQVIDTNGKPVPKVAVVLRKDVSSWQAILRDQCLFPKPSPDLGLTHTDSDGRFSFQIRKGMLTKIFAEGISYYLEPCRTNHFVSVGSGGYMLHPKIDVENKVVLPPYFRPYSQSLSPSCSHLFVKLHEKIDYDMYIKGVAIPRDGAIWTSSDKLNTQRQCVAWGKMFASSALAIIPLMITEHPARNRQIAYAWIVESFVKKNESDINKIYSLLVAYQYQNNPDERHTAACFLDVLKRVHPRFRFFKSKEEEPRFPLPTGTQTVLDNEGGYSHVGRRLHLLKGGNAVEISYTDALGCETSRKAR